VVTISITLVFGYQPISEEEMSQLKIRYEDNNEEILNENDIHVMKKKYEEKIEEQLEDALRRHVSFI
jgi:hypothetical protein